MCRHYALVGTPADISPIHWRYGAIARLKQGERIDKLLYGGYSTISLGYIGIYEMTKLMKGVPHTAPEGHDFAIKVMKYMKDKTQKKQISAFLYMEHLQKAYATDLQELTKKDLEQ